MPDPCISLQVSADNTENCGGIFNGTLILIRFSEASPDCKSRRDWCCGKAFPLYYTFPSRSGFLCLSRYFRPRKQRDFPVTILKRIHLSMPAYVKSRASYFCAWRELGCGVRGGKKSSRVLPFLCTFLTGAFGPFRLWDATESFFFHLALFFHKSIPARTKGKTFENFPSWPSGILPSSAEGFQLLPDDTP